jgi:hypothetical protein
MCHRFASECQASIAIVVTSSVAYTSGGFNCNTARDVSVPCLESPKLIVPLNHCLLPAVRMMLQALSVVVSSGGKLIWSGWDPSQARSRPVCLRWDRSSHMHRNTTCPR